MFSLLDNVSRHLAPAAVVLAIFAGTQASAETKLRVAAVGIKGDMLSIPLEKWAEWVAQRSNGEIKIQVYNESLGVEATALPPVVNGTIDAAQIVNGNLAKFTTAFLSYDLPFMFRRYENAVNALSSPFGRKIIEKFESDVGVKYLFPISNGMGRDVQTSRRPLKVPADIKGLKIRVLNSPVDFATFRAWGANPTPLETSQMYSALQRGVVDGIQQSLPYVLTHKYYEVIKYNIRLDYQAPVQIVYMNKAISPRNCFGARDRPAHMARLARIGFDRSDRRRCFGWSVHAGGGRRNIGAVHPDSIDRNLWIARCESVLPACAEGRLHQ
jgi:TRAP-type C4-dicarboxylate transport system substrate-binding protein